MKDKGILECNERKRKKEEYSKKGLKRKTGSK